MTKINIYRLSPYVWDQNPKTELYYVGIDLHKNNNFFTIFIKPKKYKTYEEAEKKYGEIYQKFYERHKEEFGIKS